LRSSSPARPATRCLHSSTTLGRRSSAAARHGVLHGAAQLEPVRDLRYCSPGMALRGLSLLLLLPLRGE
jgi:hypothetical protein